MRQLGHFYLLPIRRANFNSPSLETCADDISDFIRQIISCVYLSRILFSPIKGQDHSCRESRYVRRTCNAVAWYISNHFIFPRRGDLGGCSDLIINYLILTKTVFNFDITLNMPAIRKEYCPTRRFLWMIHLTMGTKGIPEGGASGN